MLFKLSFQNFKKSIRDYSIYFFTLILGVSIFYIFNSISSQTAMMEVSHAKSDSIAMMNTALSAMSVLVSFILGFLIVYANRFLMKKRKREFGTYLLLGMHKKDISTILLIETIFIGMISLFIGLAIGIVLSQFMSLFVANQFEANMKRFVFVVSDRAIEKTFLYFLLIYFVVAIMNFIMISQSRLIHLLNASRRGEKNRLKNPVLCLFVFLSACLMLSFAYYNVTKNQAAMTTEFDVLLQIFLGIFGTFLIFWSISGLIMLLLKKFSFVYYKRLNSFVISEANNQINTTVFAGSIICLLLFATICIVSSAFTLKDYKEREVAELAPISASLSKSMKEDSYSIRDVYKEQSIDLSNFKEMIDIYTYHTKDVLTQDVLGSYADVLNFGENYNQGQEELIHISDYNLAARFYGKEELSLEGNEYIIVSNFENTVSFYNEGLKVKDTIQIGNTKLKAKYRECKDGFLMMSYTKSNMGLILVPDDIYFSEEQRCKNYHFIQYAEEKEHDRKFTEWMDQEFSKLLVSKSGAWSEIYLSTRTNIYDNSIGSSGMVVFIALYLGMVFIISGAAILALKEMSDAIDSKEKYRVLRKIGTKESDISHALFLQMVVFFGFPLLLAVIHSIFGIQVCNAMLNIYHSERIFPSLITTGGMIILIYGGYFIASYLCCKKLIRE